MTATFAFKIYQNELNIIKIYFACAASRRSKIVK